MDNEADVVDQLKNLNKIWSNSTAATTSDGNKSPDINADIKRNQQKTSTPLEKAISKLSSVTFYFRFWEETTIRQHHTLPPTTTMNPS
jgi:hypothetical protein